MRRAAAALAALAAAVAPAAAWACPQCAGREGGGLASGIMLGAFILLPFAVAAVVAGAIRRAQHLDATPEN